MRAEPELRLDQTVYMPELKDPGGHEMRQVVVDWFAASDHTLTWPFWASTTLTKVREPGTADDVHPLPRHGVALRRPAPPSARPSTTSSTTCSPRTPSGGTAMSNLTGAAGTYRPCRTCHAPVRVPVPRRLGPWTWSRKAHPTARSCTYLTPHLPDCPAEYADPVQGVALRLPGRCVADLTVPVPPVPVDLSRVSEVTADGGRLTFPPAADEPDPDGVRPSPVRSDLWWDHPNMDPDGFRADAREAVRRESARPGPPPPDLGYPFRQSADSAWPDGWIPLGYFGESGTWYQPPADGQTG
jgi:hypothetical protein